MLCESAISRCHVQQAARLARVDLGVWVRTREVWRTVLQWMMRVAGGWLRGGLKKGSLCGFQSRINCGVKSRCDSCFGMVQPLLNLGDAANQEQKKKKKPFSRPRKGGDGNAIARVVTKKPKEPKQPVVVQSDAPEKKSQKRKCVTAIASHNNRISRTFVGRRKSTGKN